MKIAITIDTGKISSEEILATSKLKEVAAILEDIANKLRNGKIPENDTLFDCECKAVGSLKVTNRTKKEAAEYKKSKEF
jgi:basic membrane lipoprotein Med (substrate-binding protein (PBP1-ABC) superfamily)